MASQSTAVSLYVPCYNVAHTVGRVLDGVLAQTHRPNEVIAIDDGSTDDTLEVLKRFTSVRVIRHEKNRGLAAARNTAFQNARYPIVAALDADAVPESNWLATLLGHFDEDRTAMAGGALFESQIHSLADRWRAAHATQSWGEGTLLNPSFMFGNNSLVRLQTWKEIGGYNENFRTNGEDADFSRRLREQGWNTVFDGSAIVNHLRTDDLRSIARTMWRYHFYGSSLAGKKATLRRTVRRVRGHVKQFRDWMGHDVRSGRWHLLLPNIYVVTYLLGKQVHYYATTRP